MLAHCLSGAAIQLQGARVLAARESASARVREAIERASDLVNDGLVNARAAVGALRGEPLPGVADLDRPRRRLPARLRRARVADRPGPASPPGAPTQTCSCIARRRRP